MKLINDDIKKYIYIRHFQIDVNQEQKREILIEEMIKDIKYIFIILFSQ